MPNENIETYFHCAPSELSAGSIIHPGNWGRILNLYEAAPGSGLPTNVFKEALFEQARLLYAPKKPSRLGSIFACRTLDEAIIFRDKYQKTNFIYEVSSITKNANIHFGDYEFAILNYPQRYFQSMFDYARDYWTVLPASNHEVLLDCSITIVELVNRPT